MEKYYFTFGSDPAYPYGREDYLVVIGKDRPDCVKAYMKKYPPREPDSAVVNCADIYSEASWVTSARKYYKGKEPVEVITSDEAYGCKPEGFASFWLFVPKHMHLLSVTGDISVNANGIGTYRSADYVAYSISCCIMNKVEAGKADDEAKCKTYTCLADAIPDIMYNLYGNAMTDAVILTDGLHI